MRTLTIIACWLCCLSLAATAADRDLRPYSSTQQDHSSAERVALVIGNSQYKHGRLRNPVNDARLIAGALKQAEFDVITGYDLDEAAMRKKIREFTSRLQASRGVGLFYFAGHGAQFEGENYLVPIQAHIDYAEELKTEGVSVDWVLSRMDRADNRLNILVLDACRNNPFPSSTREVSKGLTGIDTAGRAVGTYIAYASAKNRVASDGQGANSPFSHYLGQALGSPGLELDQVFRRVRGDVKNASVGKQVPWSENAVVGSFFFLPGSERPAQERPDQLSVVRPVYAPGYHFKDSLRSGGEGPQMVVLPTGSYRRGDLNGGFFRREQPVRKVTIIRSIAMMTYEVTFADYDWYVWATRSDNPSDAYWGRATRPVIFVSWEDVQRYARWLSEQTGKRYRLPSEAEWEYAARAGTKTAYFWGNAIGHNRANCYHCRSQLDDEMTGPVGIFKSNAGGLYDLHGNQLYDEMTAPVGSFKPNAWGLYDMHGNVWEWVADCYDDDYEDAPVDASAKEACDWKHGSYRVLRGGSWSDLPANLRSAHRGYNAPANRNRYYGFRLVQDLSP